MNAAHAQVPSFATSPWDEVAQIYRQVCLLRLQGRGAEAAQLYAGKFSEALDVIEQFAGPGPVTEARVQSLLAAEDERVAQASVLAELLTPLLVERLREIFLPDRAQPLSEKSPAVDSPAGAPANFPGVKPAHSSAPTIADFIEGMLAQERSSPPGAHRAP